jgi:hypothetical protein
MNDNAVLRLRISFVEDELSKALEKLQHSQEFDKDASAKINKFSEVILVKGEFPSIFN